MKDLNYNLLKNEFFLMKIYFVLIVSIHSYIYKI